VVKIEKVVDKSENLWINRKVVDKAALVDILQKLSDEFPENLNQHQIHMKTPQIWT
jgi:hypothetical protein